jgi:hypothetical protein
MSASELLLLVLGRGDSGADADWAWDWEIAREMNQSWPRRCCLPDANRAADDDNDERVPVAWIDLEEGARVAIDGEDDDDEGSRVVSEVRWRVAALPLGDGGSGCVAELGPCLLRDLYQDATSPCGGSDGVSVVGAAALPHSSYERRAGTNFGALTSRLEMSKPADEDSVCQGSGGSSLDSCSWTSYSARM